MSALTMDDIDTLTKETELGARRREDSLESGTSSRPLKNDPKPASPFWFQLAVGVLIVILYILIILQFTHEHEDDDVVVMSTSATLKGHNSVGSLYAGEGEWVDKVDTPLPADGRSDLQVVACGSEGKIFLLGGASGDTTVLDLNLEFDPVFETYQEMAPIPTPRFRFGAACSDSMIYVVGGFTNYGAGWDGESVDTVDAYNVVTNEWTTGLATMLAPRGDLAVSIVGTKLFAFGGYGFQYAPADTVTEIYDIVADSWSTGADIPSRRGDAVSVAVGTDIYLLGGWVDNSDFSDYNNPVFIFNPSTAAERYDTTAGTWTQLADMQVGRGDSAVAAVGDKVYIIGGETATSDGLTTQIPVHDVEQYDIANDVWIRMAPIPAPRFRFAAAASGDTIFTFGGHQQSVQTVDTVQAFYYVDRPNVFLHEHKH